MLHSSDLLFNNSICDYTTTHCNEMCLSDSNLDSGTDLELRQHSLSSKVSSLIPLLTVEQPFAHFNMGLSASEIDTLNKLHVKVPKDFSRMDFFYYGNLINLYNETKTYLELLSSENKEISESAAKLITNLTNAVMKANPKYTSAQINIRAYENYKAQFEYPNYEHYHWHIDPCLNELLAEKNCAGDEYAVVFTLKGAPTLFSQFETAQKREEFLSQYSSEEFKKSGRIYIEKFASLEKSSAATVGDGTIFATNGPRGDKAVLPSIHTAPTSKDVERLFILISPDYDSTFKDEASSYYWALRDKPYNSNLHKIQKYYSTNMQE